MAFNIETMPNKAGKPAILLRQAWREGQRIRKKTIANLSKLPPDVVEGFRIVLKGGVAVADLCGTLQVTRSLHHGHVAAALGTARRIGLERMLHRRRSRERDLALAAITARVIAPDSKLATARRLSPETADSSLGALLGLGPVSGNAMLGMLDWLRERQPWIERSLANRHLGNATLILYDVSSSYLEGRCCPLAAFGHSRDAKKGKMQITFGLLCVADAVAEISGPDFPGERLMVCLNPRLRDQRERKREALLRETEAALRGIADSAARHRPGPANRDRINRALGAKGNRRKMLKHFDITVGDGTMTFRRNAARVAAEAALDGIYVVRTSLPANAIGAEGAVEAYKKLSTVERAFRAVKTDLRIRPLYVHTEEHVRGHVFLCMLSCYIEWHMRRSLAPLLFEDDDRPAAQAGRRTPVGKACVSPGAKMKADAKRTADGFPVHSFRTLLDDLSSVALNTVCLPGRAQTDLAVVTTPTRLQSRAFELLEVNPGQFVPIRMTA